MTVAIPTPKINPHTGRANEEFRTVKAATKILKKKFGFPFLIMHAHSKLIFIRPYNKLNSPERLHIWRTMYTPGVYYAQDDCLECLFEQVNSGMAPNKDFKCLRCGCDQFTKDYRSYHCKACDQAYYWELEVLE